MIEVLHLSQFHTQQESRLENKKGAWCTLEGKLAAKISDEVPLLLFVLISFAKWEFSWFCVVS